MDKIIGLRLETDAGILECSAVMRRILARLCDDCGLTYDHLLFPYADALLLDETLPYRGGFFGTHALLWGVGARELARCAMYGCADTGIRPRAVELSCTQAAVGHFLSLGGRGCQPDRAMVGDFERLLAGTLRPWTIRENARRFCSFAEHIARLPNTVVLGTAGGRCVVSGGADFEKIASVYAAKTGCECRITEYQ